MLQKKAIPFFVSRQLHAEYCLIRTPKISSARSVVQRALCVNQGIFTDHMIPLKTIDQYGNCGNLLSLCTISR